MPHSATHHRTTPTLGFGEFVALMAALMALTAVGIDATLPALPQIGEALGVHDANRRQWIITIYLLGFGIAQIVYGPLSDRLGRKPVLLAGVVGYIASSLVAAGATSFDLLLAARGAQGAAAAAGRVVSLSIIRDRYSGRQMARVMSLVTIVFLAGPVLAPGMGTIILSVASWRWVFGIFAGLTILVLLWTVARLPETLAPELRRPLNAVAIAGAARQVLTDRYAVGYMLAQAIMIGGLYGFVNSAPQIFFDIFHAPRLFPIVFAVAAGAMGVASLLNSRIVVRLGMRRVSHVALIAFVAIGAIHCFVSLRGDETIWSFAVLQAAMMGCLGLAMGNFSALAMEPLGEIAGTASSVQGFVGMVAGSLIGLVIGQSFDGTTVPLSLGYFTTGLSALAIVLVIERGRLFAAHPHDDRLGEELAAG